MHGTCRTPQNDGMRTLLLALAATQILSLGDSYTIGESVPEAERFPNQLARELGVAPPTIFAKTGWTTDELGAALNAFLPKSRPGLVTLLIGVNNQYRGRDASEYRDQFRALLARAIGFAAGKSARVIVVSIPDWSVTPFAAERDRQRIAAEIDAFNAINRDEAGRAGAAYVDVTPISRRAADDPGLTASDGLHPSGSMYAAWASEILPKSLEALGRA